VEAAPRSAVDAALLAEYTALKKEQARRIAVRDSCLYLSMVANVAIAAAYALVRDAALLLLIPFVSTVFLSAYFMNDSMIAQIRRHIEASVLPRFSESDRECNEVLFGWEQLHRRWSIGAFLAKLARLAAVWVTMSATPIAALALGAPAFDDMNDSWPWMFALFLTALPYVLGPVLLVFGFAARIFGARGGRRGAAGSPPATV
jgi:hypothetical protein